MPNDLDFSVILPLYHGGDLLRRTLAAARRLDYPADRFEVLVAGPPDAAAVQQIVEEAAASAPSSLRYVAAAGPTRAACLNAAIAVSKGRFLAFIDDDVFVEPQWLAQLHEVFLREPAAGLIGGVDVQADADGAFDAAFDAALGSFFGSGRSRRGDGVRAGRYYPRLWNMAMPRAVAEEAAIVRADGSREVFSAALPVHEDVELGERVRRLGRLVLFAPEVCVRHRRKTTFAAMVRRDFQIARVCRAEGLHRWGHRVLAAGLVCGAILGVASIFCWPPRAALAILGGAYAAALVAVGGVGAVRKRRLSVLVLAPAIAASLHLARAVGYLVGRRGRP